MGKKKKKKKAIPVEYIIIFSLAMLLGFQTIATADQSGMNQTSENYSAQEPIMELAYWIPPPPPEEGEETEEEGTYTPPEEEYETPTEDEEVYYEEEEPAEEEEYEDEEEVNIRILPPYPPYPPPPPPVVKQKVYKPPKRTYVKKDPNTAMLYSLFLPGLGQFYCEEPGKGMMFMLAEGIFIGLAAYNYSLADHYQRKGDLYYYFWDDVTNDYMTDDLAYHYSDKYENRYNNWMYVLGAIHILNVIDARNSAHEYNQRHKLSYKIINSPNMDRVGVALIYKF